MLIDRQDVSYVAFFRSGGTVICGGSTVVGDRPGENYCSNCCTTSDRVSCLPDDAGVVLHFAAAKNHARYNRGLFSFHWLRAACLGQMGMAIQLRVTAHQIRRAAR